MCLPLMGRITAIDGQTATVELIGGEPVRVSLILKPDAAMGAHVLIDRGMIIEVIAEEEADTLLAFYAELETMWAEEDARSA